MKRRHAVVLGAGMSGLLAARVLSDAFDRVSIVERDALDDAAVHRRGVPQGRQVHVLLPSGGQILEELFPGLTNEMLRDGAVGFTGLREVRLVLSGHEFARAHTGEGISATRPFLERAVLRRVRQLSAVHVIDGHDAVALVSDEAAKHICGVRIAPHQREGAERTLDADLVLDAMGRAARTPSWLSGMGYQRPADDNLQVNVAYASQKLRLPARALDPDRVVVIGPTPRRPYTLVLCQVEGNLWHLGLASYTGNRPPTQWDRLCGYARQIAPADVAAVIAGAEPVGTPASHQFPRQQRRRYERLKQFPAGLLVAGDALCSFNPVYAQGMSVAAQQAVALRHCLEDDTKPLARRYFAAASTVLEPAWRLATGADMALQHTSGSPSLGVRLANAYIARIHSAAAHDTTIAEAFTRVSGLLDPPTRLLRPAIAWRTLRPHARIRTPSRETPVWKLDKPE